MNEITDNPNYELCKACGGTGWAYYANVDAEGKLVPEYISPTMVRYGGLTPCSMCHRGALVGPDKR